VSIPSVPKWFKDINSPWPIVALVAFEIGALTFAFSKQPEWVVPLTVFGSLFALVLITVYAIERLRNTALAMRPNTLLCRWIPTRRDLYLECAKLISSCQIIRDTTWGKTPRNLTKEEAAARKDYRRAVARALNDNKDYRELFCVADERKHLFEESLKLTLEQPNYEVRLLETDLHKITMLDMLIGDNHKLILSHVAGSDALSPSRYLYIESEELASLMLQFFADCWVLGKPLNDNDIPSEREPEDS